MAEIDGMFDENKQKNHIKQNKRKKNNSKKDHYWKTI